MSLRPEAEGIRLRWDWPEQCKAVLIVRRQGKWPDSSDDPQAKRFAYSQVEYENNFDSFFDSTAATGELFYIVYAQPYGAPERIYSQGISPGCRGSVQPAVFGELRYSLKPKKKHGFWGVYGLLLEWRFSKSPDCFSGFRVIGSASGAPSEPMEGVELFRWQPENTNTLPADTQEVWFMPGSSQLQRIGKRFY
ncbi:MAG: hypothetical protein GY862_23840, partial [Gammaproteobacteria bacterium]|nr:hypothetical protein [Gammaproteobacteria bacterium]